MCTISIDNNQGEIYVCFLLSLYDYSILMQRNNQNLIDASKRIPFENVLTILVSIFLLLCDERKRRESVRLNSYVKGEKGEGGF